MNLCIENRDAKKTGAHFSYISLMRNIAIILVLLGHAGCIYAGKWDIDIANKNCTFLKYITEYIYSFHMPLYVFIAGFLYKASNDKFEKQMGFANLIYKKTQRLLVPYLLTGIFFVIPVQALFGVYGASKVSYVSRITNEILKAQRPTHLWFLLMLFSLFVLFRIIENIIKKNTIIENMVIFAILNIASYPIFEQWPAYYITSSLKYLIYFYLGYIIYEHINNITLSYKKALLYFSVHMLLFCFRFLILLKLPMPKEIIGLLDKFVVEIIAVLAIMGLLNFCYCICNNKTFKKKLLNNPVYLVINKSNFYLYLLHHPIMLALVMLLKKYHISPLIMFPLLFFLTLILSLLCCGLIFYVKEKWLDKFLHTFKIENALIREENGRTAFWDNLKFLLILLVVLGHAADFYTYNSINMRRIYLFIYSFHMPLFIFISGYFSKKSTDNLKLALKNFLYYIILFYLLKMFFLVTDLWIFGSKKPIFRFFTESGVPWYMFALGSWTLITYFIKKFNIIIVFICSIILSIICGYMNFIGDFLCLSRIIVFYPYFLLGWYITEDKISYILSKGNIKTYCLTIFTFIFMIVILKCNTFYELRGFFSGRNSYFTLNRPFLGGFIRAILYLVSAIMSLSIIYIIPKGKIFFTHMGSKTLQIYFLHYVFLTAYNKFGICQYIALHFPYFWKEIYLCYAITIALILSCNIFSKPFDYIKKLIFSDKQNS